MLFHKCKFSECFLFPFSVGWTRIRSRAVLPRPSCCSRNNLGFIQERLKQKVLTLKPFDQAGSPGSGGGRGRPPESGERLKVLLAPSIINWVEIEVKCFGQRQCNLLKITIVENLVRDYQEPVEPLHYMVAITVCWHLTSCLWDRSSEKIFSAFSFTWQTR